MAIFEYVFKSTNTQKTHKAYFDSRLTDKVYGSNLSFNKLISYANLLEKGLLGVFREDFPTYPAEMVEAILNTTIVAPSSAISFCEGIGFKNIINAEDFFNSSNFDKWLNLADTSLDVYKYSQTDSSFTFRDYLLKITNSPVSYPNNVFVTLANGAYSTGGIYFCAGIALPFEQVDKRNVKYSGYQCTIATPNPYKNPNSLLSISFVYGGLTNGNFNIASLDFWYGTFKPQATDPYDPGGVDPGNPNGGDGTFDDTSDLVPIPEDYPNFALPGRGFFRIWVPTAEQLSSIAEWLWTSDFVEQVKKMFGSPMEAIFSLFALPVTGITSTPNTMVLGNVNTNITVNQTGETFVTVDCGAFDLKRYWGSALDYSPNTRISIYLPYVGVVALNIDDIQQTQLHVVYRINLITGDFVCLISANGQLIYHYTSNCAFGIPISANDYSNTISHLLSNTALIGGVIAAAATGGLTAPAAVGAIGQSVANAFSSKPQIQRSSGVSNSNGWLDKQKPYLIIERANQSLAAHANKFEGYPCNATFKIADLQGYTEVENIHLENIPATLEELSEIENIMKGGFII